MYHLWFLIYQRVLPQLHLKLLLHHLHHRISYLMSTDTPKIQYKMGNAKKYEKMCRMNCVTGFRIAERIWSMKTLQQQCFGKTQSTEVKTLPSHLMNFQWSREWKWNRVRVSTVYIRTFLRTQIVMSAWTRKQQGLLAEDVLVQSCPERNILVIWSQQNRKFWVKKESRRKNIDMPWWKKIWQHSGHNHTRVNKIFQGNPKGLHEVSGADEETISHLHWKFIGIWQSLWRSFQESNYPGNIARKYHTEQEQMGLPKEQRAEWKEGHLRRYCSPVWVTNRGRIPWNVTAICETFKNSCLTGKHHVKGGSECPLTDHRHRLEQWPNITLSLRNSNLDCISLEQKSCQVFSSVMHKTREISGNETF